jgi:NAD(P)-dependent dehydrogenase (short-subunit alcohol dehydrogenase family)
MKLSGKRILIVGATSGIGRELAQQLLERDNILLCFSRNVETLAAALPAAQATGHLRLHQGDVRSPDDIARLLETVRRELRPLDGIIYASGVSRPDFVENIHVERLLDTFRVNLEGALRVYYGLLPDLIDRPDTFLVGFSSMAADRGVPRGHAYSASKAALARILESLRIDLWDRQTRVFTVIPGYIETPMTRQNRFPMPGILPAATAARRIIRGMERNEWTIRFPWYHSLPMLLLQFLPDSLYCTLMNHQKKQVHMDPRPDEPFPW